MPRFMSLMPAAAALPTVLSRGFSLPALLALIPRNDTGGVTTYGPDPYTNKNRNTLVDFAAVAALGIDFIRVFVDPGPVLASTAFSAVELANLMESVALRASSVGLTTVFTFAPEPSSASLSSNAIAASVPLKAKFLALLQGVVAKFRADGIDSSVAIELWNEPQYYGAEAAYLADITAWYAALRAIDPTRTLVIGPCHGMDPNGLATLVPTPTMVADPALLFTVHRYGKNNPANNGYPSYAFAYQGLSYGSDWIAAMRTPLKWHPTKGLSGAQIATAKAAAISAATATATAAGVSAASVAAEIGSYFDTPASVDVLTGRGELGAFTVWAAKYGITPQRLFLGEFGCFRYRNPTQGGVQQADAADYMQDFSLAAETLGIGWCAYAYDAWDGTASQQGSSSFSLKLPNTIAGQLDPVVLGASGLRLKI